MQADSGDPFHLQRFVAAQSRDYEVARSELLAGRKRSHWIWYVLPQLRGLGTSEMSRVYGIASLAEAAAYLRHSILGRRLRECVAILNALPGSSAESVLGHVDAIKLRSCLTLFAQVEGRGSIFRQALDKYFGGEPDARTLALLADSDRGQA